ASTSSYFTVAVISGRPSALDDRVVRGADRLTGDRRDLAADREQLVAARGADVGDGRLGDELVARIDRPDVLEALLAVDHHGEVEAQLGVGQRLAAAAQAEHDGEGGRGHHVRVTGRLGRRLVVVDRVVVAD